MKSSPDTLQSVLSSAKAATERGATGRKLPPVHLWDPQHCGDIGMEIRADGSWWHQGARIGREKMVRLFSTILRKDDDGQTYLVTPHEKVIVRVEDAHFLAARVDVLGEPGPGQVLQFTTQLGDIALAGHQTPLRVEEDPQTREPSPYVTVRGRLEARLTRAVYYELAELAVPDPRNAARMGVWSDGVFFPLGSAVE